MRYNPCVRMNRIVVSPAISYASTEPADSVLKNINSLKSSYSV